MKLGKANGAILEQCITRLDNIAGKYSRLLYRQGFDSLRPQFMFDVDEVFTFAWKETQSAVAVDP